MEWMYRGPGQSSADKEEYLLGKAVDKTFEESHRLGGAIVDATPAPLLGRGAATSSNASQVDIARKINEDPLVKIKLAELEKLKKARDKFIAHNLGKNKVILARRGASSASSEGKDSLDDILAQKLDSFVAVTRVRLGDDDDVGLLHDIIKRAFKTAKKQLENSDSSSDSGSEDEDRHDRRGRREPDEPHRRGRSPEESNRRVIQSRGERSRSRSPRRFRSPRRSRSRHREETRPKSGNPRRVTRVRSRSRERSPRDLAGRSRSSEKRKDRPCDRLTNTCRPSPPRKPKLSAEEIEKRRQEMLDNATWREEQRKKNVARLNAEEEAEEKALKERKGAADALLAREFRKVTDGSETVESVIKANRKKLQKRGGLLTRD